MHEKRLHKRNPVEIPMSWSGGGREAADATCRDVSLGGCFLETVDPPPVGAPVLVRVKALEGAGRTPWEVHATVRWSTARGMGVQFGLMGARQTADLVAMMRTAAAAAPQVPADPLDSPSLLQSARFPRSSAYHPRWILDRTLRMHPLWIMEWLTERIELAPHMRVLVVGSDGARSAIFLAREWGVQVMAADSVVDPNVCQRRIDAAGCRGAVIPIRIDAARPPFADASFDVVIHADLADGSDAPPVDPRGIVALAKPGGCVGFASAGLTSDLRMTVPAHVARFVGQSAPGLHMLDGFRTRLERAGVIVEGEARSFPEGSAAWLAWAEANGRPAAYVHTLRTYGARYLGAFGFVARRSAAVANDAAPAEPLFRSDSSRAA